MFPSSKKHLSEKLVVNSQVCAAVVPGLPLQDASGRYMGRRTGLFTVQ